MLSNIYSDDLEDNSMLNLVINGQDVTVPKGTTLLEAAATLGVKIPTLCHLNELEPLTSCMLCVVQEKGGRLLASCSSRAQDGMVIETDNETVHRARRQVLDLLLSEHVGDCEAPCTRICPAHLDIPNMLRAISSGDEAGAAWIARRDLGIPEILGHICIAPCEKGCRRKGIDEALHIRAAHRNAAAASRAVNQQLSASGRQVAIDGSGPAALSCAWQLRLLGYQPVLFDRSELAGGSLLQQKDLPAEVLAAELAFLRSVGVLFRLGTPFTPEAAAVFGVVVVAAEACDCPGEHVFFAKETKLPVKAVANGKKVAREVEAFLSGRSIAEFNPQFDSKVGELRADELGQLEHNCPETETVDADRCLHCDCRKATDCRLREYAQEYGASQKHYLAEKRQPIEVIRQHDQVVYEPGKCIKCGICVRITEQAQEKYGLTFLGRGFHTQVRPPLNAKLDDALTETAQRCIAACPTAALAAP